jgi:Phosphotransferase enzyme family
VKIEVVDPFDAANDPALPTVKLALDPHEAQRQLGRQRLLRLTGPGGFTRVHAIRVTRHKPGRRCVIEYDVEVERPEAPTERLTLIGKIRFARFGISGYRLLSAFWDAGFDAASADGISVPEPIGAIGKLKMWLQRKVPGVVASEALTAPNGVRLVRRIAEAAHKVHLARVPTPERHTMADELRILRECLTTVGRDKPELAARTESLFAACERLAAATARLDPVGIHRDFYADQVIVDGPRLYLLDFDLYCEGEPALDIGNFLGHLTEQSLRVLGRPDALADRERALADRFVELAGEEVRATVTAYATLTLARHVYLSTQFPERRPFTRALLELCEERVAAARSGRRLESRCA